MTNPPNSRSHSPAPGEVSLRAPRGKVDLLVIAGEHSGDEHAARLIREAKALRPDLEVAALGGEMLEEAGAEVVFDLVEHSVIGFVEVIKNIGFFRQLFEAILQWVEHHRPRHVLLVDYPGLNLRLARALHTRGLSRKGGGTIGVWYYIAPQIWAWKAKRRFKMAETLDGLGCILPFEPQFFADTTLEVNFVGHPFVHPTYQLPLRYDPAAPLLLLPGSRVQQVERVFPLQLAGFGRYQAGCPTATATVIFPSDKIARSLEAILEGFPEQRAAIRFERNSATVAASAVLMSSGTMSLACALAGIPGAIVQRVQPLTYALARMVVRIDYIGLANIILERELVREYIQRVDIDSLAEELRAAVESPGRIEEAQRGSGELRQMLEAESELQGGAWLVSRTDS